MTQKIVATPVIGLDYELRITLDTEKRQIDLRKFDRMTPANAAFPTKEGLVISLSVLADVVDGLICAEGKAKELGLCPTHPLPSPDEIAAAQTKAGGWDKATLNAWGVAWPPPAGWRADLEAAYAAHEGRARP